MRWVMKAFRSEISPGDTAALAVCSLSCYTILLAPPSIMGREEASPADHDG